MTNYIQNSSEDLLTLAQVAVANGDTAGEAPEYQGTPDAQGNAGRDAEDRGDDLHDTDGETVDDKPLGSSASKADEAHRVSGVFEAWASEERREPAS